MTGSTSAVARRRRAEARPAWAISLARSSEMQRELEPYLGREIAGLDLELPDFGTRLGGVFQEIPHPSEILRDRSEHGHRLGELYTTMLRDPDLLGLVQKRIDAVAGLPRDIPDPATQDRRAVQAVDLCRAALSRTELWQEVLKRLLLSPAATGITFGEIVWEKLPRGPVAGAWVPVDVLDRPMHRFAYEKGTKRLHVRQPPGRGRFEPLPAPDMKFLALRSGSRDTPWGTPLLDAVYWLWYVKKHVHKYYAVWLERWAFPLARVKYPRRVIYDKSEAANQEQIEEALALVAAIQTDQGIAVPTNLEVDLLESTRNGSVTYDPFLAGVKAAYSLLLLGEVDTSGLGDQPGSFAKSKVSNDVRLEKVSGDAHLLEAYLTESLLTWIVRLNLGEDAPVPRYRIHAEDAADRKDRREGIQAALNAGQPVPRSYFYMTLQVPVPREGEAVVEPQAPPAQQPPGGLFPFAGGRRTLHLAADDPDDPAAQAHAEEQSADLDDAVERLHRPTLEYYTAHRQAVEAAWSAGAAPGGSLLRDVVRRLGQLPVAHARNLQAAGLHGAGLAILHLRQDGERSTQLAAPADYQRADTPEAAIEYWARLLNVPKEAFNELEDLLRRYSFTVAGVQEAALLGEINRLVERSIAEGLQREDFLEALEGLYDTAGVTPTADWHARLVYDNNVRQAHGATRYRQVVENEAGRRLIPYLRFRTMADLKVRERYLHNHAVMHGLIFATDHRIWQTWWYPAGHNCRCWVETISAPEARRRGLTGSQPTGPWPNDPLAGGPALPDPGFRSAPRSVFADAARQVQARANDLQSEAAARGASDLAGALEILFGVLGILELLGD